MIQVDLQCAYLMGAALGYFTRKQIPTASKAWMQRAYGWVYVIGAVGYAPVWLFITLRWTAWETQYTWDLSTLPHWFAALYLVAITLCCKAGFWITARTIRARRAVLGLALSGVMAASVALIIALRIDRVGYVGPLDGYHPGVAANFFGSDLSLWLFAVTLFPILPFGYYVVHRARQPI
jgi:hypothetical protein